MNIFGRLKKQLSLLAVFSLVAQILFLGATPALALVSYTFTKTNYYVREANTGDASGIRINVPNTTVATVFSVDGSLVPIPGLFTTNQGSYHVWKLSPTAFSEGEHTIEAAYTVDNITWTPIVNSAIVYSLDTAWFNYISPTNSSFVFRPSDNPGRVEIDDEFSQFDRVVFQVYNYNPITSTRGSNVGSYSVSRSACDVREAGHRVICDINDSATWSTLPDGYYNLDITSYDVANGGIRVAHAGTDSPYFYVDSLKPTITDLTIDNINPSYPVLSKTVKSSVFASDNIGIKDVEFYVTAPRVIDGVCDGNGTRLASAVSTTLNLNSRYEATINTSALNGNYCLNAITEDMAGSHSSILKQQILLDNTAPVVNLDNPTTTHVRGTVEIVGTVIEAVSPSHYWFVIQGPANVDLPYDGTQPMTGSFTKVLGTWNTTLYPDGTYTIKLEARDLVNNKDSNSVKWRTVIVDNTAPTADIDFNLGTGSVVKEFQVIFNEDVNEVDAENPANYYLSNWPGASSFNSSEGLGEHVSIVYNKASHTSRVTFTDSSWYVSPEQLWGVRDIHDLAGNILVAPVEEYSSTMLVPVTSVRNNEGLLTLTFEDNEGGSGVKYTYYNLDDEGYKLYDNPLLTKDGEHQICYYSVDNAGNVEEAKCESVLVDNEGPVIETHEDLVVKATSKDGAEVSYESPLAVDIVDTESVVTCEPLSGSVFPIGKTLVKCTSKDSGDNTSTSSFSVIVEDKTAPVITLNGITPDITVGGTYTELGATVNDIVDGVYAATVTGVVNTNLAGTYIITYSAVDTAGNVATQVTRIVSVVEAPTTEFTPLALAPAQITTGQTSEVLGSTTEDQDLDDPDPQVKGSEDLNKNSFFDEFFGYKVLGLKTWIWLLLVSLLTAVTWWFFTSRKTRR